MHEEVQRRVASPPIPRQPPPYTDPAYECPQGFWVNVPPNFISIRVRHQGGVMQARYATVKFYHNPIIWGTMGHGFRVFEQPAHAAPHLTPREATPYVHNDLQLLTSRYLGRDWVNNTLIDKGNEGLCAEALRYRRMMDEMTEKEAELNVIQDRIAVLTLDLQAAMQRLLRAEAVTRIEDRRTTAVAPRALSAWVVERGRST